MNLANMTMDPWGILIVALFGINIVIALYALHKIRRIHIMHFEDDHRLLNLYRQLESLYGIYLELGLTKSLPATRGWAASPDFLMVVCRHALTARPKVVVECGSGTSTVALARCMQINSAGHIFSLEHDPEYAEKTRENLNRHGLEEWATVIDAPLEPVEFARRTGTWYAADKLPTEKIDMVVIDGPPVPPHIDPLARYPAGPILFPRLSGGGIVFLDDMIREGEKEIVEWWMRDFPDLRRYNYPCEKGCVALIAGDRRSSGSAAPGSAQYALD